jgi:hypothetical protein
MGVGKMPIMATIGIFISHSHSDVSLAKHLVQVIKTSLDTPKGAIRASSVPGAKLPLGSMPAQQLRGELATAEFVLALITPSSLRSPWVLFELGAAWAGGRQTIPLLLGNVEDRVAEMPEPLRNPLSGKLDDSSVLHRLIDQLAGVLHWERTSAEEADSAIEDFVAVAREHKFPWTPLDEIGASFTAKLAGLSPTQSQILQFITRRSWSQQIFPEAQLGQELQKSKPELFYRLETLRLLEAVVTIPWRGVLQPGRDRRPGAGTGR